MILSYPKTIQRILMLLILGPEVQYNFLNGLFHYNTDIWVTMAIEYNNESRNKIISTQ